MVDIVLTREEKSAVASLKRLAKRWPKSLWLFVDGSVNVMRCGADGERVDADDGSPDQDYTVATIHIPCDGGGY